MIITNLAANRWEIFTPCDPERCASVPICVPLTLSRRWFMFLSAVQLTGPSVEKSRG